MSQSKDESDDKMADDGGESEQANPYDAPLPADSTTMVQPSTLLFSAAIVFACSFICGLIGMGIGVALGVLAPGYYQSVFSGGGQTVDPVQVGLGLGLTQGVLFGGVIGLVLVAMYYWYKVRMAQVSRE